MSKDPLRLQNWRGSIYGIEIDDVAEDAKIRMTADITDNIGGGRNIERYWTADVCLSTPTRALSEDIYTRLLDAHLDRKHVLFVCGMGARTLRGMVKIDSLGSIREKDARVYFHVFLDGIGWPTYED